MKKIFFFAIILFAAILTACAAQSTDMPTVQTKPTASATPTFTATNIPATSTHVIACATSQCATFTPRPTQTNTKTPQPSPTANIREGCITIQEKMPDDLTLSGIWVVNNFPPFLEDIQTHTRNGIPMGGGGNLDGYSRGGMAISPDGTSLAYIDSYLDTSNPRIARATKHILRVVRSSGYVLNMDYWTQDWQSIIGWVDNENIALALGKTNIVILNPATGKWKKFDQPDWAVSTDKYSNWFYDNPFSPTMQWFLEEPGDSKAGTRLKNMQTGLTTWQIDESLWSGVEWARNGTSFTTPFSTRSERLILVIKDGLEADKLPIDRLGYEYNYQLKISPDGEKITFQSTKKTDNWNDEQTLTVFDTALHKLGRLCSDKYRTSWWSDAVWSPDSRYIIQMVYEVLSNVNDYPQYSDAKSILVDTQEMQAYLLNIPSTHQPVAWLAKP